MTSSWKSLANAFSAARGHISSTLRLSDRAGGQQGGARGEQRGQARQWMRERRNRLQREKAECDFQAHCAPIEIVEQGAGLCPAEVHLIDVDFVEESAVQALLTDGDTQLTR
jgi:hypothetical protein